MIVDLRRIGWVKIVKILEFSPNRVIFTFRKYCDLLIYCFVITVLFIPTAILECWNNGMVGIEAEKMAFIYQESP